MEDSHEVAYLVPDNNITISIARFILKIIIYEEVDKNMKLFKKTKKGLKFVFMPWRAENQKARFWGTLLLFLTVLFAVLIFNSILHYTSTENFCLKCHEMKYSYNWYKKSKHGSNSIGMSVNCVDCHLPVNFISYVAAKAVNIKEVYVHIFHPIKNEEEWKARKDELDEKARESMKNLNCTRCHKEVKPGTKEGKEEHEAMDPKEDKCVDCHADIFHIL